MDKEVCGPGMEPRVVEWSAQTPSTSVARPSSRPEINITGAPSLVRNITRPPGDPQIVFGSPPSSLHVPCRETLPTRFRGGMTSDPPSTTRLPAKRLDDRAGRAPSGRTNGDD